MPIKTFLILILHFFLFGNITCLYAQNSLWQTGNSEFPHDGRIIKYHPGSNPGGNNYVANDTICGALELKLDAGYESGNTAQAALTDPMDGYLTSIGCSCSVLNNTLWYFYYATANMNMAYVMVKINPNSSYYSWLNVLVAHDTVSPCTNGLSFIGCQTGPNPSSGIDSAEITIYGIIADKVYYFMMDGYSGSTGDFTISLRSHSAFNSVGELGAGNLVIYPNPAQRYIRIESGFPIPKAKIILTNSMGQVMLRKDYELLDKDLLELSKYGPGVYFLTISNSQETTTRKILIQ